MQHIAALKPLPYVPSSLNNIQYDQAGNDLLVAYTVIPSYQPLRHVHCLLPSSSVAPIPQPSILVSFKYVFALSPKTVLYPY